IRRLNREELTSDDFAYLDKEEVRWEEVERLETGFYETGRKDGRKEGKEEGKEETALDMLKFGLDIKDVSKITGIPVSRLKDQIDQNGTDGNHK
ncbi:MAG: hypothetical protein GY765_33050, partial [bacterium]|nr:hypothetical protein [bacterium]